MAVRSLGHRGDFVAQAFFKIGEAQGLDDVDDHIQLHRLPSDLLCIYIHPRDQAHASRQLNRPELSIIVDGNYLLPNFPIDWQNNYNRNEGKPAA